MRLPDSHRLSLILRVVCRLKVSHFYNVQMDAAVLGDRLPEGTRNRRQEFFSSPPQLEGKIATDTFLGPWEEDFYTPLALRLKILQ